MRNSLITLLLQRETESEKNTVKNSISPFVHLGVEFTQGKEVSDLRDAGQRLRKQRTRLKEAKTGTKTV